VSSDRDGGRRRDRRKRRAAVDQLLPNAVYSPVACIQLTLKTARAAGLPLDRLIFEFTENEEMMDPAHIQSIVASYQKMGFGTALDDFGAGHAGLTLLARFQPDIIKLDMELVRHVDRSLPRRMIVASIVKLCESLNILAIAEGSRPRASGWRWRISGCATCRAIISRVRPSRSFRRSITATFARSAPPELTPEPALA
jgi:predicted signal transduction protein with EAL and GGDEF domain